MVTFLLRPRLLLLLVHHLLILNDRNCKRDVYCELNWSRQMQNSVFELCYGEFMDGARPLMAPTGVHCSLSAEYTSHCTQREEGVRLLL